MVMCDLFVLIWIFVYLTYCDECQKPKLPIIWRIIALTPFYTPSKFDKNQGQILILHSKWSKQPTHFKELFSWPQSPTLDRRDDDLR